MEAAGIELGFLRGKQRKAEEGKGEFESNSGALATGTLEGSGSVGSFPERHPEEYRENSGSLSVGPVAPLAQALLSEALWHLDLRWDQQHHRREAAGLLRRVLEVCPGTLSAFAAEVALDALGRAKKRAIRETILARGVLAFALRAEKAADRPEPIADGPGPSR